MIVMSLVLFALCIFLMGGSVYSFVNLVADRLPENKPIVLGRSQCDSCGRVLGALDMIPVFSYIFLRGKCRSCKAPLSLKYFLTELAGGILALYMTYIYWGSWLQLVTGYIFVAILACVLLIDMATMSIPDRLVIAMAAVSVISVFIFRDIDIISRIIGFFSVSAPMLIIALAIDGAFGGGDIKLMAFTGFFLGWQLNLLSFFIAIITAGIYAVVLLTRYKKGEDRHFAFGPFLAISCTIAFFWGKEILNWYIGLFM